MPSLRKRVTSYFRQLSFHNEPREQKRNFYQNSFITKYLQGEIRLRDGPPVLHGKIPTDIPNYEVGEYATGPESIVGCYTGPKSGLTLVKRHEKHLSVPDEEEIDFIDTAAQEEAIMAETTSSSPKCDVGKQPVDNTSMVIKVAGQEYYVTNRTRRCSSRHGKSHSLGSLSEFGDIGLIIEKTTKINKTNNDSAPDNIKAKNDETSSYCIEKKTILNNNTIKPNENKNKRVVIKEKSMEISKKGEESGRYNNLSKSKSDGNPFRHQQKNKKRGNLIKVAERPTTSCDNEANAQSKSKHLPPEWSQPTDQIFGISQSLYDTNQITHHKNGDPIADCFGIIARSNSSLLAVADGVNWGEKAAIAARSAINGALYYLNTTIFNTSHPFETEIMNNKKDTIFTPIRTTREIFICLLRAFNCAHDLILENNGMLTTLTVAVILPLKRKQNDRVRYVCCVCNVGDTLAYVYSKKYGVRELTKGSHDVNLNRDMRDALGALGPVDGINPELGNLTVSVTTLSQGDIVMVASDGLTDNFDPNVCRFTVEKKQTIATATPSSQLHNSSSSTRPRDSNPKRQLNRSKTTIEVRSGKNPRRRSNLILHNADGLPFVSPLQRYELQLLMMEDVLKKGISGAEEPCLTAKRLCENLVGFAVSITAAKRRMLEDKELYFNEEDGGVWVEVSGSEQKVRRKKGMEKVATLPGKLDHISVVAWNVANVSE